MKNCPFYSDNDIWPWSSEWSQEAAGFRVVRLQDLKGNAGVSSSTLEACVATLSDIVKIVVCVCVYLCCEVLLRLMEVTCTYDQECHCSLFKAKPYITPLNRIVGKWIVASPLQTIRSTLTVSLIGLSLRKIYYSMLGLPRLVD